MAWAPDETGGPLALAAAATATAGWARGRVAATAAWLGLAAAGAAGLVVARLASETTTFAEGFIVIHGYDHDPTGLRVAVAGLVLLGLMCALRVARARN